MHDPGAVTPPALTIRSQRRFLRTSPRRIGRRQPAGKDGRIMSLRFRLVAAIVALSALGLGVFGVVVTTTYARSQRDSLDDQLEASIGPILGRLGDEDRSKDDKEPPVDFEPPTDGRRGPPLTIPAGFVAELREGDKVLVRIADDAATSAPDLTSLSAGSERHFETVGSSSGSGEWRVLVSPLQAGGDNGDRVVVVAVPLEDLNDSINRMILLQTAGAAVLLVVLGLGCALVVRRALRPLEEMAGAAAEITDGALDRRVTPSEPGDEVGQLGHALNTMLDSIEAAFAQRDATEANLRRFLADASHELRTPLTSIQGFAELGLIGTNDQIDPELAFTRIQAESHRMRRLVDDLLLLARLDEHRPVQALEVDLSVVVADAATDARAVDSRRPLSVDAATPAKVIGDPDLIRQAIGNLVTNSLRHTPAGTPIHLACRIVGDQVEVTVRDHGPGFPQEALEVPDAVTADGPAPSKAFDRFWQADLARTGEGSGLGLAIVAAVLAEHHGSVTAENHPTGGAVVKLRFPLAGSE